MQKSGIERRHDLYSFLYYSSCLLGRVTPVLLVIIAFNIDAYSHYTIVVWLIVTAIILPFIFLPVEHKIGKRLDPIRRIVNKEKDTRDALVARERSIRLRAEAESVYESGPNEELSTQIDKVRNSIVDVEKDLASQQKNHALVERPGEFLLWGLLAALFCFIGGWEGWSLTLIIEYVLLILVIMVLVALLRSSNEKQTLKERLINAIEYLDWLVDVQSEVENIRIEKVKAKISDYYYEHPEEAVNVVGPEVLEMWHREIEPLYRNDRSRIVGYNEFYPRDWYWRKYYILQARGMHCEMCGEHITGELHLHHIQSAGRGGTHEFENLSLLCKKCHEEEHGGSFERKRKRSRIRRYHG